EPDEKKRDAQLGEVLGLLMQRKLYKEMIPVLDRMTETEENRLALSVFRAFAAPKKEMSVVRSDPASVTMAVVENLFAHPNEPPRLTELVTARFAENYDGRQFRDALHEFATDAAEEIEPLALAYLSHMSAKLVAQTEAGARVRVAPDAQDRDHAFEAM